jgi:hypothetical protein
MIGARSQRGEERRSCRSLRHARVPCGLSELEGKIVSSREADIIGAIDEAIIT